MVKQASNVRKRLRRFLTADPGRFAGGSAVSDPLGLLAVERERLAVLRSPGSGHRPAADQGARPGVLRVRRATRSATVIPVAISWRNRPADDPEEREKEWQVTQLSTSRIPGGFTEKTAQVNGVTLNYATGGTGPAVVLLHGYPQTWYMWRKVMPALAEQYTVIAPDLRGSGGSDAPATG